MDEQINNSVKQIVIAIQTQQTELVVGDWLCQYSVVAVSGTCATTDMRVAEAFGLAAALQKNTAVDVDFILPAEMALMQSVQLPSRNQRQALQALPFVVEEQLADDIEKAHIAIGQRQADGAWPVVIVDLVVMSDIMACCEKYSLLLRSVYVDAQLLPVTDSGLAIAIGDRRVLLHTKTSIVAFDIEHAAEMIHFFIGDVAPSEVKIWYTKDSKSGDLLAQQLTTEFTAQGDTQVETASVESFLSIYSFGTASFSAINLLQGRFLVRRPSGNMFAVKWVVSLALCVWLGQCLLQIGSGWYFDYQAAAIEKSMSVEFKKLFPDARLVGGVRKQIESRLLNDASANNGDSFAKLFGLCVQVLNDIPSHETFQINQLRYDSQQGQVEIEVKAKSIDQLDQYKQALGKAGLSAKISSANDSDSGIDGRMQIGRGL